MFSFEIFKYRATATNAKPSPDIEASVFPMSDAIWTSISEEK
jgi:hypothetical protein